MRAPEHPNAVLVRRLFDALTNREVAVAMSIIAPDAVWYFPGTRGALAGEHRGREAIVRFKESADENAVALFTGHGQRNGKTLDNPTSLRVRIRDGHAVEFREFVWDLAHVKDFWG